MKRRLLISLLACVVARSVLAQDDVPRKPPPEFRRHLTVTLASGTLLYRYTTISRFTDAMHEHLVLVRDEMLDQEIVIRDRWTYDDQMMVHRVSDLDDRAFLQQSFKMPLTAKDFAGSMAEARLNRLLTEGELPTIFKLETNGGVWEGDEKVWEETAAARTRRHDLRLTMNPALLEAMERMRGTFFATEEGKILYRRFGRLLLYGDETAATDVKAEEAAPDCDFDEAFGFPCSEAQLAKIAKAKKEGKALPAY